MGLVRVGCALLRVGVCFGKGWGRIPQHFNVEVWGFILVLFLDDFGGLQM